MKSIPPGSSASTELRELPSNLFRFTVRLSLLLALFFATEIVPATTARATTYNSPVVDGPIYDEPDSNDWQPDELLVEDPAGDSNWGAFNDLTGLWVTWDAKGLYVGVQGFLWDTAGPGTGSNSVNVYLDADFGQGTGITNMDQIGQDALGAISRNLWRPLEVGGGFGADFGFTSWAGTYDRGILDLFDPAAPVNLIKDESQQVGVNVPCADPSGLSGIRQTGEHRAGVFHSLERSLRESLSFPHHHRSRRRFHRPGGQHRGRWGFNVRGIDPGAIDLSGDRSAGQFRGRCGR